MKESAPVVPLVNLKAFLTVSNSTFTPLISFGVRPSVRTSCMALILSCKACVNSAKEYSRMSKLTVDLMPSTVTMNLLLVASTLKLVAVFTVGVEPDVVAAVEGMPRVATVSVETTAALSPSAVAAAVLTPETVMLEASPVVPDSI